MIQMSFTSKMTLKMPETFSVSCWNTNTHTQTSFSFFGFGKQKEEPAASEKNHTAAYEKPVTVPESLKAREPPAARNDPQVEVQPGESGHIEYTELTLDCLDLKAQEELLSTPLSGD